MEFLSNMAEYLFVLLIVLYLVFLYIYRRRIGSSKPVFLMMLKMEGVKKTFSFWYLTLNKRRFFIKIIVLLLLITGGVAAYLRMSPERRFNRLIEGCADLVEEEKYEQAVIDMSNALRIKPDYARGHYFLAFVHRKMGDQEKSEASLQKLVQIDPKYEDSTMLLTEILERRGDVKGLNNLSDLIWEELPVEARIVRAKAMVLQGRPNDAHRLLKEAGIINPNEGRLHILQGELYAAQGLSDDAAQSYENAIEINYGLWQAHYGLARIHLEKGNLEDALWELNATRSLNRDFSAPGLLISQVYMGRNETDKAITLLEGILDKNTMDYDASYLLAMAYSTVNRFQEAVNLFIKLPEDWHKRDGYLYNLAFAYFRTGKYTESLDRILSLEEIKKDLDIRDVRLKALVLAALGRFEDSLLAIQILEKRDSAVSQDRQLITDIRREVEAVRVRRAEVVREQASAVQTEHAGLEKFFREKDYAAVIEGAKKAIEENSFKAPFRNLLGVAYLADNKTDLAREQFRLSYDEYMANPAPLVNLVNIYIREGEFEKAATLLSEHNRRFETETLTRMLLGKVYLRRKMLKEASELFQRVIELDSSNYEAHQQMAIVFRLMEDSTSALREYEKSLKLYPNDVISLNDAANIHADTTGNLDRALEYASRAEKIVPQNPSVLDTLGYVHYLRGEDEKALPIFKKAFELNPYLPDIPFHMGQTQFRLGMYEKAKESLKLAVNMERDFRGKDQAEELLKIIEENAK